MAEHAVQGNSAKEIFERDGFLQFDPHIPERTIDRALAPAVLGLLRTPYGREPRPFQTGWSARTSASS